MKRSKRLLKSAVGGGDWVDNVTKGAEKVINIFGVGPKTIKDPSTRLFSIGSKRQSPGTTSDDPIQFSATEVKPLPVQPPNVDQQVDPQPASSDGTEPIRPDLQGEPKASLVVETQTQTGGRSALTKAFRSLVIVFCGIAFLLLVIAIIINIVALVVYYFKEMSQSSKLSATPILIADTTDYQAMQYAYSDKSKDPYSIYVQQSVFSQCFFVLALVLLILFVQAAIYLGMSIWAGYNKSTFNEEFSHSPLFIGIGIATAVIALILQATFNSKFVNSAQPSIRTIVDRQNALKKYIYGYMSTNTVFLKALREENSAELRKLIQSSAQNASALPTLTRMAITYNIYKFFSTTIPDHNRSTVTLGQIFTPEGIKSQKYHLLIYTVYKSLPIIENHFINDYGKILLKTLGDNYSPFVEDLNSKMDYIGNNIDVANEVVRAKSLIKGYLNTSFFNVLLVLIVVIFAAYLTVFIYRKLKNSNIDFWKFW